jgi:hypothetical protein
MAVAWVAVQVHAQHQQDQRAGSGVTGIMLLHRLGTDYCVTAGLLGTPSCQRQQQAYGH